MTTADFPSDTLPALRLLSRYDGVPTLAPLPPERLVVVDATVAVRAALMKAKFKDPTFRTNLEEIAATGTWILIAPPVLRREVRKGIRKRFKTEAGPALAAAEQIFRFIRFVRVPKSLRRKDGPFTRLSAEDPKDLPYAWLLEFAKADFVWTGDKDLARCGFRVMRAGGSGPQLDVMHRDQCRIVADSRFRLLCLTFGANLSLSAIGGLYRRMSLPGLLALLAGGFIAWEVVGEEQRRKLKAKVAELKRLGPLLFEFFKPFSAANKRALADSQALESAIPARDSLSPADGLFRLALEGPLSPHLAASRLAERFRIEANPQALDGIARRDARLVVADGRIMSSGIVSPDRLPASDSED